MKTTLMKVAVAIFLFLAANASIAQTQHRKFHIGFVYPLSTNGPNASQISNSFSLHALAGVSAGENGFSATGVGSRVHGNVNGFMVSGVGNLLTGNSHGFLASGVINTFDKATGVQLAGVANFGQDSVHGAQLSGVFNTAKDVHGIQIAGVINIARKVNGVQLAGLINIADSSDYTIGLVNIVKNGEHSLGVMVDDNASAILTWRSGGRILYGILGVGGNLQNDDDVFAIQYGIGANLVTKGQFRLKTELTTLMLEDFHKGDFMKQSLTILPEWRIGKFHLMAGPSLHYLNTNSRDGRKLSDDLIWDNNKKDRIRGMYIGYTAGVSVKL